MLGWDQEGVHNEEIHQELHSEEELRITESAEEAMAK